MKKKCQVIALPADKAPELGDIAYVQGAIDPWGIVSDVETAV